MGIQRLLMSLFRSEVSCQWRPLASIRMAFKVVLGARAIADSSRIRIKHWLLAPPITSCGLKLDDEAVRVAVGTWLALKLCIPYQCRCGSEVDSFGRHSLVCFLARQALQPSWQHLTRWSSMLDCHHRVNSSRLRSSPTAQSTGMLFSS